jgi:hypothetical protein
VERRIWTITINTPIFPNLFVLLVGGPGAGKTPAIEPIRRLWKINPKLTIAADNISKAGLMDAMNAAKRQIPSGGQFIEYSSMSIAVDELSMFLSSYDWDLIGALTGLYDGRDVISEQRRHALGDKKRLDIINPLINVIAGAQPSYMNHLLPEEMWGMGFTSRFLMIYSSEKQMPKFTFGRGLNGAHKREDLFKALQSRITDFGKLYGPIEWDKDAEEELQHWSDTGGYPEPEHSRLLHYNPKRAVHLTKLSMISTLSRGEDMRITKGDFHRAKQWLLHAESLMPNIFREMKGKSDHQVLKETHSFMWEQYVKTGKKPIHESLILAFLSERTYGNNAGRLLELMERMSMAQRDAGTQLYTPKPTARHILE